MARKVNEENAMLKFYIRGSSYHNLEDAAHVLEREDNVTEANVIHPANLQ